MKDSYLSCKLVAAQKIKAILFSPLGKEDKTSFLLITDDVKIETLRLEKVTPFTGGWTFELYSYAALELGHKCDIVLEGFGRAAVTMTNALSFPDFDGKYTYEGDDLGARHTKEATSFALWAPLASQVVLELRTAPTQWLPLDRGDKGVYRLTCQGDLGGVAYRYHVTNNGISASVTDPYAFGSTLNGEMSVVVDFSKLDIPLREDKLPKLDGYTDAIIYEASVRDMTSDPLTAIKNKGRFLGLIEEGLTTEKGNPIGFDYLVKSGITHLQLLPIYDFQTVDERDPSRFYNWGYDPQQYFVPEGSFASVLDDPYSRLIDLRKMVAAFHEKGLRVVMDVVFNHVYHAHLSVFEKVVPDYYFRRRKDGRLSNGSFCGNDVASERPMVRKLIVDAVTYWVKTFGIDGYRFDLMSNIDMATMRLIDKKLRSIKPDIMLYGEGWNMPTELAPAERSSLENGDKLPTFAYFNDSFREIVKGGTMDDKLRERGYLLGAASYRLGFKFAWVGSCLDLIFPSKFAAANQSINYVECHDNGTLYDKLAVSNGQESLANRLKRIKLMNAATMLAFGIPFFHMGQEIGLSKQGDLNSYKSGDKINKYDYRVLDERVDMFAYLRDLTRVRKTFKALRLTAPAAIEKSVRFEDVGDGALLVAYVDRTVLKPYHELIVMINPTTDDQYFTLDGYMTLAFSDKGWVLERGVTMKDVMIEALSLLVFVA